MSRFFINRPIFAWVLSIIVMLAGLLSLKSMPVAQYPNIAPPQIRISAQYPGASAQTMQDTVTQVLEQQLKGLDGMMYMSSSSDSNGRSSINISFTADTDPDTAQVQVQNKISSAISRLPQEVQRRGVNVNKASTDTLMVVALVSEDGRYSGTDLGDFAESVILDPLSRVQGVGEVSVYGSKHAMRIWLDPQKLVSYSLSPSEVLAAVQAQNTQVSVGQLGALPQMPGQGLNATVISQTLLSTVEEFEDIILGASLSGATITLKDVARVEKGSDSYNVIARINGKPSAGIGFNLAPGANALDTATAVKAQIDQMQNAFPEGVTAVVPFDTTPFIEVSINSVVATLIEAIVLVFLVMYLFLQNFRATLIPTIAVPVVLLGTFAILSALGYSLNTLTLFGVVLAIGLLVDDAIVVVENVERLMAEENLSPVEATKKSMDQISGALVGIGLVISAVLVPMAFFAGSTGIIYRQFSITIVSAMLLSVLVALILTPALCATLLKPHIGGDQTQKGFFAWFNRAFDRITTKYVGAVSATLKRAFRAFLLYLALVGITGWLFTQLPSSFLPEEDQGVIMSMVTLPAGATQPRTIEVLDQIQHHFLENEKEAVDSVFTIAGFSFAGSGQNAGMSFIRLKPWEDRPGAQNTAQAVAARAAGALAGIQDAMAFAFTPPAIQGMGESTGFELYLQDQAGVGHEALTAARNQLLGLANKDPRLVAVRPSGMEDTPQFEIEVDQAKAMAHGVSPQDVNAVLSLAWGGTYVNDFLDQGRVKRVYIQAEAEARMNPEDLKQWFVKNKEGSMVPLSEITSSRWTYGSPRLERFNGVSAMKLQGGAAPGTSSGQAMQIMEELAQQLPNGFSIAWTGASYQEMASGDQAPFLFAISILAVFLCLAALYESWTVPFAVILVVPLGVLGALLAASGRGMSNDVYFQVGLLVTMGLAAKNAIMIVEFAKELIHQGKNAKEASLQACRMRLRPIIMTSLAFGLGIVPLVIATGAGSGSQNSIGTGVLGGTIMATTLGLFIIPLLFYIIQNIFNPGSREVIIVDVDQEPKSIN